jgi:hypothetical protein
MNIRHNLYFDLRDGVGVYLRKRLKNGGVYEEKGLNRGIFTYMYKDENYTDKRKKSLYHQPVNYLHDRSP